MNRVDVVDLVVDLFEVDLDVDIVDVDLVDVGLVDVGLERTIDKKSKSKLELQNSGLTRRLVHSARFFKPKPVMKFTRPEGRGSILSNKIKRSIESEFRLSTF